MRSRAVGMLVCVLVALPTLASAAGPGIFLRDEPEDYVMIEKLQGFGLLPALMTGTRGLEAREVALEAGKEGNVGDPFVDGMLRFLELEGAMDLDFRIGGGLGYSNAGYIPPNAQGVPVPDGAGYRVNGFFRAAPYDWLGFQARAEVVGGFDGERTGRIEETSLLLGWPQATLEVGRFAVWYGPGRHGALLFTTNAEPLIGVRIRNPRPIAFPKAIGFLGEFQYDFFMARIDTGGPYPDSRVSGMRFAIRPNRYLEFGASRALHYGGEGQDESFSTFWDILTGQRESEGNTPKGNSLASIDAKVHLPFRVQPVVLYGEWGGEDQSQPFVFTRHAWLAGIFLPSIGTFRKADLRIEYGTTLTDEPGVWYQHSQYPHQYNGQILGHHMGTDAKDLFLEARYFLVPSSYIELNYDQTERSYPGPANEKRKRIAGGFVAWVTKNVRAEGKFAYDRYSDAGGVSGNDGNIKSIELSAAYQYR
jgi:Capsule assembly protein Wzi